MKVLFIGGTRFVGHEMVCEGIRRGHDLTLIHRGQSAHALPPQVRHILANREQLSAFQVPSLKGEQWDAVVDTCAYHPADVLESCAFFKASVRRYALISTISAYSDFSKPQISEEDPLECPKDWPSRGSADALASAWYGPLKALCEKTLEEHWGIENALTLRPSFVLGERDPSQRFLGVLKRIKSGELNELPDSADHIPFQWVDVSDLSTFLWTCLEHGHTGLFNCISPIDTTFGEMIDHATRALGRTSLPRTPRNQWDSQRILKLSPLFIEEQSVQNAMKLSYKKSVSYGFPSAKIDLLLKRCWHAID